MGGPLLLPMNTPLIQPDQVTLTAILLLLFGGLLLMVLVHRLQAGAARRGSVDAANEQLLQVGQWLAATPSKQEAIAATGRRAADWLLSPTRFAIARLRDEQLDILEADDGQSETEGENLLRTYRVSPDLAHAEGPLWRTGPDQTRALITPVRSQAHLQGILIAEFGASEVMPERVENLASHLAAWLGPVLERLSLREEAEARGGKLMLLSEISRRLITLRPLEERWSSVAPLISQVFGFAEACIYESGGNSVTLIAHSHSDPERTEPSSAGLAQEALERRDRVSAAEDPESAHPTRLAVPLMVEDRLLGVLTLTSQSPNGFDEEESALAEMLAGQLAIAALEAQNFSQQQEYTWYNTVMLEVARHASQPGDPEDALRSVLQLTTMLAGAEWALLLLADESTGQLSLGPSAGIARTALDEIIELKFAPSEFGLEAPHTESDSPFSVELPDPLGAALTGSSSMGFTLSDGEHLLGLLLVSGTSPAGPRKALIAGIGHQISLRIENARLVDEAAGRRAMERELETARNIQESFLPDSLPDISGWEIGATWLAARQVGGDFFDFIPLPEGERGPRWGVVIADVADKGVPAALFMALCRTLVRSVAVTLVEPGELLGHINELILADTRSELFVSLFYGLWEPDRSELQYASAGHNPPIVLRADGQIELIREHGMVLGVSPRARYQTHKVELDFGTTMVLYTDGVTEAMNEHGAFFGLERLSGIIQETSKLTAQELAQRINHEVRNFCLTDDPPDDLTTVVMRRMPEGRENDE
ncbi:MAG: SpoIIE family protein phosphatase [Anaerolineales bacterium]|nr:SpoIIE family protein phosphatase [Anaerolineales bacterium]